MIRDYTGEFIYRIKDENATKERHSYYKNIFMPETNLDRAVRWFYLNRTSYSGIMNKQNCYWGYGDKYSMRRKIGLGIFSEHPKNFRELNLLRLISKKL